MDNEKLGLLAEIFWEMNQLDAVVETHTDSTESETSVETEVTVLVITVTHKTAQEMAQVLNFDSNQKSSYKSCSLQSLMICGTSYCTASP